jgi:hypothetical protein
LRIDFLRVLVGVATPKHQQKLYYFSIELGLKMQFYRKMCILKQLYWIHQQKRLFFGIDTKIIKEKYLLFFQSGQITNLLRPTNNPFQKLARLS